MLGPSSITLLPCLRSNRQTALSSASSPVSPLVLKISNRQQERPARQNQPLPRSVAHDNHRQSRTQDDGTMVRQLNDV